MATNGANPNRPPFDVNDVRHVPVTRGYLPPPPPPPRSSRATHGEQEKPMTLADTICCCVFSALMVALFFLMIYYGTKGNFPRIQLDSVSASVRNATVVWDIGFSTEKSVGELEVWARFMSRDFKVVSPGNAGNATVTVTTWLPRGATFPDGLITLEQVVFVSNNYKENNIRYIVRAACKDVTVWISTANETWTQDQVALKGGPRSCPVVYYDRTTIINTGGRRR